MMRQPISYLLRGLLASLTLVAIVGLRIPLVWVLLGLGIPAFSWTYHRIHQLGDTEQSTR